MVFIVRVALGVGQHESDVLGVRNVARCAQANLAQWVEAMPALQLHRGKFQHPLPGLLLAPSCSECVVFALDVINHSAVRPAQKSGQNKANTLTRTRWSKRNDVLRAVVPQVVNLAGLFVFPAADIHAFTLADQAHFFNVFALGPACRAVQVFIALLQLAGAGIHDECGEQNGCQRAACSQHQACPQNLLYLGLCKLVELQKPNSPHMGHVDSHRACNGQRFA